MLGLINSSKVDRWVAAIHRESYSPHFMRDSFGNSRAPLNFVTNVLLGCVVHRRDARQCVLKFIYAEWLYMYRHNESHAHNRYL